MTSGDSEDAVDRASERDRRYFERHPEATSYERRYIMGEFAPGIPYPMPDAVKVTQVFPGMRVRQTVYRDRRNP